MQQTQTDDFQEQEKRTAKALAGLANGSLKVAMVSSDTWHVQNGDRQPYLVIRAKGAWACDCPDWTGCGQTVSLRCKHIEAVRLSPPAPFSCTPSPSPQKETLDTMKDENTHADTEPQAALRAIADALAAPFPASAINWKPQTVTKDKTRALAVAYIDARDVMDRLDEVVGAFNWQVEHLEASGQLVTRIGIKNPLNGEWVWKADMGFVGGSESSKEDDQVKAIKGTPSDGLKRAGVEWSIGRYLYKLPNVWVDFDADRRQLKATPVLPLWALPEAERHSKGKGSGTQDGTSHGRNDDDGKSAATGAETSPRNSPPGNGRDDTSNGAQAGSPSDELARARAVIMTLGSDAVRGKPLGELGRDVWDYLAAGQFKGEDGLVLQKAARLLLTSPS